MQYSNSLENTIHGYVVTSVTCSNVKETGCYVLKELH